MQIEEEGRAYDPNLVKSVYQSIQTCKQLYARLLELADHFSLGRIPYVVNDAIPSKFYEKKPERVRTLIKDPHQGPNEIGQSKTKNIVQNPPSNDLNKGQKKGMSTLLTTLDRIHHMHVRRDLSNMMKNFAIDAGKFVLKEAVSTLGPAIGVQIVSTLVEKTLEYFIPTSNYNVGRKLLQKAQEMEARFNLTEKALNQFYNIVSTQRQEFLNEIDIWKTMTVNNQAIHAIEVSLTYSLTEAIRSFTELAVARVNRKLKLAPFILLSGLQDLLQYPEDSIEIYYMHAQVEGNSSIRFKTEFVVHMPSQNSYIIPMDSSIGILIKKDHNDWLMMELTLQYLTQRLTASKPLIRYQQNTQPEDAPTPIISIQRSKNGE